MVKKSIIRLLICMFLLIMFPTYVFAREGNYPGKLMDYDDSQILGPEKKSSTSIAPKTRGQYIALGILSIINEDGLVRVNAETLAYVPVDEIIMDIYIDRRVPRDGKWVWMQVADYSFNYKKEDKPDQKLTDAYISFTMLEQPADCYYRARAFHVVYSGGAMESFSNETDGIYITKNTE